MRQNLLDQNCFCSPVCEMFVLIFAGCTVCFCPVLYSWWLWLSRWELILEKTNGAKLLVKVLNIASSLVFILQFGKMFTISDHLSKPIISDPHPLNTTVQYRGTAVFQCRVQSEVEPTIQVRTARWRWFVWEPRNQCRPLVDLFRETES